jgi:hypothetical protein
MTPGFSYMIRGYVVSTTHRYQNETSKQAFPRILWVVFIASIQENRPLITGDGHLTTSQLFFDSIKQISIELLDRQREYGLWVGPIHSGRAKKTTGAFMVKATVHLHIS